MKSTIPILFVIYSATCNGFTKIEILIKSKQTQHNALFAIPPIGPFCPFRSEAAVEMVINPQIKLTHINTY